MKRFSLVLALSILSAACSPSPGDSEQPDLGTMPDQASVPSLSLIAGALGGSGSTDGTGASARFDFPFGMAMDGAGNLYIADSANHTIRKVAATSGAVTTLAGSAGWRGSDDGTGAVARFDDPRALALDGMGNLYVADSENHTIRKVVIATGTVTTLAGDARLRGSSDGMGAAARFNSPSGLAADAMGNLYVADSNNYSIRKVVIASGAVTTIAGMTGMSGSSDGTGAAARFSSPEALTVDGAGNLYVADTGNHVIRKVVASSGVVTTFLGTAGMSGTTDGTGAAARFYRPRGVLLNSSGTLFISDSFNHTLRQAVVATGAVSTLAGTGGKSGSSDGTGSGARLFDPTGLAADGAGNLYVVDTNNSALRKVVIASGAVSTLAGSPPQNGNTDGTGAAARFDAPSGMVADGAGNVYVADTYNQMIRKVVIATGAVTTIAGAPAMIGSADGTGSAARFHDLAGMALDGSGNLYVADTGNNTIRQVVLATGAVTTLAGTAGMSGTTDGIGAAARFFYPSAVALDGAGNLYVVEPINQQIRKVVVSTRAVTTIAGSSLATGSTDGIGTAARFRSPQGIAVSPQGDVYIADTENHTIRKLEVSTSSVTTVAGSPLIAGSLDSVGPSARFSSPQRLAFDQAGNLFIADSGNSTIRKLQLADRSVSTVVGVAGQRKVVPGPLPGQLNRPIATALLPAGGIAILDENSVLLAR